MRRRIILVALALGLALFRLSPAAAGAPGGQQTGQPAMATEEMVIRLLPYLPSATDLPEGYRLTNPTVDTPATIAFTQTPPGGDPYAMFAQVGRDLLLQAHLGVVPAFGIPAPPFSFTLHLMTDTAAAAALAGDPRRSPPGAEPVPLDLTLGEASAAWHLVRTPPDQAPDAGAIEVYSVRWQRGSLVFEVQSATPLGGTSLADTLAFAERMDAREAELPAPDLSAPAVAGLPAEGERLDALLKLATIDVSERDLPGYQLFTRSINHPASAVLAAALPGAPRNPDEELQYQAVVRRAVIGAGVVLAPVVRRDAPVFFEATVHTDADAARAALDQTGDVPAGVEVSAVEPPLDLGDVTAAFRVEGPGYYPDGSNLHVIAIEWTHGPVRLSVSMEGQVDMDLLTAFAQRVEAAYQASALAPGT
jgi:hypothetical protein